MITFSVSGIVSTKRNLLKNAVAIKTGITAGLKESSEVLGNEVRASIKGEKTETKSVDTGNFLSSIKSESDSEMGVVSTDVDYAKFLEFGTSKIQARRHFKNTENRNRKGVVDIIRKAVQIRLL